MTSYLSADSFQPRILRAFTVLYRLRSDWAGALILSLGLSLEGAALSMAANLAGGVCLSLDEDASRVREVVRSGVADFVVITLDEAIRAMKNELRQHRPLSVVLHAPIPPVLEEIVERGLAPQLFSNLLPRSSTLDRFASQLGQLGAILISFEEDESPENNPSGTLSSRSLLAAVQEQTQWKLHTPVFASPAGLRDFDARALQRLPPGDNLRRHWLESASRLLQRQRPPQRSLWLTPAEAEDLLS